MGSFLNITILAVLAAMFAGPVYRQVTLLGVLRKPMENNQYIEGQNLIKIEDTMQCEDLHYHAPSNKLFTACEDSVLPRFEWFPPMKVFKKPSLATGSIHVIDPVTMKSTRLTFEEGFSGPFITHGIDILEDPERPDAVYIFAVNHAPHPAYRPGRSDREWDWDGPKARSQIELFHHVLDTTTATHVRSIRHPLIKTPNDIYAENPYSFFVTNDHGYRDGVRRAIEDIVPLAKWSSTIHVRLDKLQAVDAEAAIDASVALTGLFNNNGFGHGKTADDMLLTSAAGGMLYLAQPVRDQDGNTISVKEEIPLDSDIDNPSYFTDVYRTSDVDDASGFVLAGLRRPIDMATHLSDPTAKDGVMVWYMRPNMTATRHSEGEGEHEQNDDEKSSNNGRYETRLLFEDDGTHIRTAATAVLVPIPSQPEQGKKAWLFVTGFYSESMIAVKVDL